MAQNTEQTEANTQKGVETMIFENENFCSSESLIIVNTIKKRCTGCGKCKCKNKEHNDEHTM